MVVTRLESIEETSMDNYREYLQKYAKKHGISEEEAEQHVIVKEAKAQYEKKDTTTKTVGWKEE